MTLRFTKFLVFPIIVFIHSVLLSQDYDAQLIDFHKDILIRNDIKTVEIYFEVKINNRAGERFTKISIPYSKLSKVSNIEAFIKDSSGKIIKKLKKDEITDKSSIASFSFYEDDFVKEFTLKHSEFPYTLVYSYQYKESEFVLIDNWLPVLHESVPTKKAGLTLKVPLGYKIHYNNNLVDEPVIDTLEDYLSYSWKASYTELIEEETMSPAIQSLMPGVQVVPDQFKYESEGSLTSWTTFGNWQYNLMQGLNELPYLEKLRILDITDKVADKEEKIRLLYHYLQDETRYLNITLETGGLKPFPATYVVQNKYGDCKALTNYFKAMLEFLNIPSYYTKIHAGERIKAVVADFPSQQFNHIILNIPRPTGDIWLDCTSDGAFGYLGTFCQNRDVLIVKKDSSRLFKTPALKPTEVLVSNKINIRLKDNEAIVLINSILRGELYETILNLDKSYNEAEKAKIVRNYFVPDGFQLNKYIINEPERDSAKLGFMMEISNPTLYQKYGNDLVIHNIATLLPAFEKPKNRKLPVQIDYPIYRIDTLVYQIPPGYKMTQAFGGDKISGKYGAFNVSIQVKEEDIVVVKNTLIKPVYVPISEYEAFYGFMKQITDLENKIHFSLYKD